MKKRIQWSKKFVNTYFIIILSGSLGIPNYKKWMWLFCILNSLVKELNKEKILLISMCNERTEKIISESKALKRISGVKYSLMLGVKVIKQKMILERLLR
jgi:hypothetical protein